MHSEKYPFCHVLWCKKLCIWVVSCGVISLCTNSTGFISMYGGMPLWPMGTAECNWSPAFVDSISYASMVKPVTKYINWALCIHCYYN